MSPSGVFVIVKSKSGMMFGALVSGVSFGLRPICGTAFFDFRGFVLGKLGDFGGVGLFYFALRFGISLVFFFLYAGLNFFPFLDFFIFKDGTAGQSVDLRHFLHFFLLGFDDAGSQSSDLVFVQLRVQIGVLMSGCAGFA